MYHTDPVMRAWWRLLDERPGGCEALGRLIWAAEGLSVSLIDEVLERLRQSQALRDLKTADDETLKWFDVAMRHYARMAREELDRRGVHRAPARVRTGV